MNGVPFHPRTIRPTTQKQSWTNNVKYSVMFGAINLEFAVCSFLCVPFILNSCRSHTPWFPCVAAFMKAICREHWEQTCHFSNSTFVLVPIRGGQCFAQASPIFSLNCLPNCRTDQEVGQTDLGWTAWPNKMGQIDQKVGWIDQKWAELTWAQLTRK